MSKKLFTRAIIIDDDYISGYFTQATLEDMAAAKQICIFTDPGQAIGSIAPISKRLPWSTRT